MQTCPGNNIFTTEPTERTETDYFTAEDAVYAEFGAGGFGIYLVIIQHFFVVKHTAFNVRCVA